MYLFGQKTFQEPDCLLPSEMMAKAPRLQISASWKERVLPEVSKKKKVKNPSSKEHFGSGELAGKQTLPLGSIHRQSQNWSHAQRDHAANSLELVSSVL